MHERVHRAFVLPVDAATRGQENIRLILRSKRKLRKRQNQAEDQEQSAQLTTPSAFVSLQSCVHFPPFVEAVQYRLWIDLTMPSCESSTHEQLKRLQ